MKKILNPFFLISALVLAVMPLAHSSENGADTIMKIHSAFDYQQTRERLLQAVSKNGLVLFGEFDHAKAAVMQVLACRQPPFWYLVTQRVEPL